MSGASERGDGEFVLYWPKLYKTQILPRKTLQCVSKRMELSETGFIEPYRALLKLTTQLDGLSYYTRVWQGTIGSIFGVPTVPYSPYI